MLERTAFCVGMVLVSVCTAARADVIDLKGGQRMEGDVLKETDAAIFIDVGVDVVRIPLEQIQSRRESSSEADSPQQVASEDVYRTARLPVRSIKELALKYGEAVVLVQTPSGLGSGFIIDERGFCVTNYHVVEKETRVSVTLFHRAETGEFTRRRIEEVKIIALNPFFDLALLQIPKQDDLAFQPVYLSADAEQKEGDDVFAIGNPLGLERSVSRGIVSSRNRNFNGLVYIQTTTEINPGNSGGPLFNLRGEVVGVTNMKAAFGEGLGFAIPVVYLRHFLNNRDAFAFDNDNPNTGYRYLEAPRRKNPQPPPGS